mgnify:CR=1 FL=1
MTEKTTTLHDAAPRSAELFAHARAVLPGGVNSPVRGYGSVGGTPRFFVSARGPYITDADGREYVDLVCSWGPMILGHAHPAVVDAVQQAAARGLSFGAPTPGETDLAEEILRRVPAAEREATIAFMRSLTPRQRAIVRTRFISLPPHQRNNLRKRLLAMTAAQRQAFNVFDAMNLRLGTEAQHRFDVVRRAVRQPQGHRALCL